MKAVENGWKIQITLKNSPMGICRFRVFYKGVGLIVEGSGTVTNVGKSNHCYA